MATVALIEYEDASPEVRAVYDDIREVRQTDFINNFWKGLANNPAQLRRTWEQIKAVMTPGAIDAMTKEMIYVAVSVANSCEYCIHSHTAAARAKGSTYPRLPDVRPPWDGICTECVASKMTGYPNSAMMLSERKSTTRLL